MPDALAPPVFDFRNPNYGPIYRDRIDRLQRIRANPSMLPGVKAYYREHPASLINDFGFTWDPKNVRVGLDAKVPFLLFPKQRDWCEKVVEKWLAGEPLITEKTRQMGFSWLSMALSCALCLTRDGVAIGVGSRKAEYVDSKKEESLFWKARFFMENLPPEFNGGWNTENDAREMLLRFNETKSSITGEGGDKIGRGATKALYLLDEAAFIENPLATEASLSQTASCRIDISTPNGMGNPFAIKRHSGKIEVFTFRWSDDPRKDEAWYAKQKAELDPVILAQEIDIDYTASVSGIVIPGIWVRAAIDAHLKLGLLASGSRFGALDVADEGKDKNAFCGSHGFLIESLEEWSGAGSDIFETTEKAFNLCDTLGYDGFLYDGDGMGADVRGDARVINERRSELRYRTVDVTAFRGSAGVLDPEKQDIEGRLNKDYFSNLKAQGWWRLRKRFENTFNALQAHVNGKPFDPDEIISIPGDLPLKDRLIGELSQPTYSLNGTGKIVINKAPDGLRSPNLGDCVMIRFSGVQASAVVIPASTLAWARKRR